MTAKTGELVPLTRPMMAAPVARSGFGGLLASLNWVGIASEKFSEIVEYRKEIQRLELEAKRIDREAVLRHHQIDAALLSATEDRKQRRRCVRELLAQASAELARTEFARRVTALDISRSVDSSASPDTQVSQDKFALLIALQIEQLRHARSIFESAKQALVNQSPNPQLVPPEA